MRKLIISLIIFAVPLIALSQETEATQEADTLRKDALNVYMDASSYLKERITFINYVRDRKVADLVIISTSERNGSGGQEHTMFLEGQGRFAGMIDTLKYSSSPDETYEQRREKEVKTLKMGLIRYVLKTPLAGFIDVNFTSPISAEVTTDKWNSWVFRTNINGFVNGQSSMKTMDVFGGLSAGKVTDEWKLDLDVDFSFEKDEFELDEVTYLSISRSRSASALVVKSINDHWSIGGTASSSSSTYSNYDLTFEIMPGIEYDIFPYSESTRRQFRFLYTIGYKYNNYTDTTIYNKTEESLLLHSLRGSYEVIQKWGSIDMSLSWSNYLRDFSENSFRINGSLSWRVAKGLNINIGGSFAFIHNQVSLVKGGATTEEILLRRKELETDFSYFAHFGFSYTFGSIYNNVVNPRFGGGGGQRIVMMF